MKVLFLAQLLKHSSLSDVNVTNYKEFALSWNRYITLQAIKDMRLDSSKAIAQLPGNRQTGAMLPATRAVTKTLSRHSGTTGPDWTGVPPVLTSQRGEVEQEHCPGRVESGECQRA